MKDKTKFAIPRIWDCLLYIDFPYIGPVYILCVWAHNLIIINKRKKR